MILYYGSNVFPVQEPKLFHSRNRLDFGAGFYLTSDFGQARQWAVKLFRWVSNQGGNIIQTTAHEAEKSVCF